MSEMRTIARRRRRQDTWFKLIGAVLTVFCIGFLLFLFGVLAYDGLGAIDWDFLTQFPSRRPEQAGVLSAWVGSLLLVLVTALSAIPVGIAAAIYLEEYASKNWFTKVIEINISNLAGVPSIIYGLMALGLFVYRFQFGQSILSGGLALACLVLPIVIVTAREALRSIPQDIREAAFALGSTRWQMVWHHLLPYSSGGIATGVILAISRAIGETAPLITIGALTFIAFLPSAPLSDSPPFVNFDWLESPFTALPIQMFNWISRPGDDFLQNAAAAGVLLMFVTLLLNGVALVVRYRARRRSAW